MFEKLIKINIIKTLYYNLKIIGITSLIKPKIFIGYKCKLKIKDKRNVELKNNSKLFIGVFESENRHSHSKTTYFSLYGNIVIDGRVNLCKGSEVFVHSDALLEMDNLYLGPDSTIICNKHICFNTNVFISWNCLFLDGDTHPIYDENGVIINNNRDIIVGKNTWIGCNTSILKGVEIADNVIISSSSVVTKKLLESNYIYVNNQKKKIFKEYKTDESDLFNVKEN